MYVCVLCAGRVYVGVGWYGLIEEREKKTVSLAAVASVALLVARRPRAGKPASRRLPLQRLCLCHSLAFLLLAAHLCLWMLLRGVQKDDPE